MPSSRRHFLLCVENESYEASLECRKIYPALRDAKAGRAGLVRVIDESGEDYLNPANIFVPIEVPKEAASAFSAVPP